MNLKEQEYVCALAECGNITKAAEKLFISQPALSIYIGNLEKSIGAKLFERKGKSFRPTLAGELYLEKARQMLVLSSEFQTGLESLLSGKTGRLVIGIQLRRAPFLLPPVVAKLKQEYPHLHIVIQEGVKAQLEEMLERQEIDLLVFNLQNPRDNLCSQRIYEDHVLLAVPQGHAVLAHARNLRGSLYPFVDLHDCQNETFILPTKNQSLRIHADKILEEHNTTPGEIITIRNLETAMQLVAEGIGLGFNREQYARNMMYTKSVVYCQCTESALGTSQVCVSYPKGNELNEYQQRAIELLVEAGKTF